MYYQRLPLEKTYNTRDLGGIPTINHKMVSWKKIYRSDDLSQLTDHDINFLEEYGIQTVIDLRTHKERDGSEYILNKSLSIKNYHIPFVSDSDLVDVSKINSNHTLANFYEYMVTKQQSVVYELFNVIHTRRGGGIIFHCAAGKDRTGVLASLLLGLLGVGQEDIIANYETSYTYLSANHEFTPTDGYEQLIFSDRSNMSHIVNIILEKYGTFYDYLLQCGLSCNILQSIKDDYTEDMLVFSK